MRRPILFVSLVGTGTVLALWLLLQTPGSLGYVFTHPIQALIGTQQQLNTTLIDASENETVRAAGRRLLKPLGVVRLVQIYDSPDSDRTKKR